MHDIMTETALIQPDKGQHAITLHLVNEAGFSGWAKTLSDGQRAMLEAQGFTVKVEESGAVTGDAVAVGEDPTNIPPGVA